MPSTLTPPAIAELRELLWSSRRQLSEIYRLWNAGYSIEEIALENGDPDLGRVRNSISSLKVLFGRAPLPKSGHGRQGAINEADSWLKSNFELSHELEEHFRQILKQAGRTNLRENYLVPAPAPNRQTITDGGVYVISRATFLQEHQKTGKGLVVKIGWSTNVWDRLAGAQTWDPEPIEVLRIYPCQSPNVIEAKFHICLDTLKLGFGIAGGGREWFRVKDMDIIDSIAENLELSNRIEESDLANWKTC